MGSTPDTNPEQPETSSEPGAQPPDATELLGWVVARINAAVTGTLTVHYKARDVSFELPGDVALRAMVALRRGRPDGLDDPIDLATTSALDGYMGLSTRNVLAVTWKPAVDAEYQVDPKILGLHHRLTGNFADTDPGSAPASPAAEPAED